MLFKVLGCVSDRNQVRHFVIQKEKPSTDAFDATFSRLIGCIAEEDDSIPHPIGNAH
jgi:hypothetical protein